MCNSVRIPFHTFGLCVHVLGSVTLIIAIFFNFDNLKTRILWLDVVKLE